MRNESDSVTTLLVVANLLHAVKITKLSVPEVIQASSGVITLDCEFSAYEPKFILQWHFNGEKVYEWIPYEEPEVSGVLVGRLDMDYRVTSEPWFSRRALRILDPSSELTGVYSCSLLTLQRQTLDSKNASMLVYSPEQDFLLVLQQGSNGTLVNCTARGVYPQPTLEIEVNQELIPKQSFRVWRSEGMTFDAEGSAAVLPSNGAPRVTCRLLLSQAGYMAIREINQQHRDSGGAMPESLLYVILLSVIPPILFLQAHDNANIHQFL